MEKIMAVITKERQYAERLSDYINSGGEFAFTATAFGSSEEYGMFPHRKMVRLVLADSEIMPEQLYSPGAGSGAEEYIELTEGRIDASSRDPRVVGAVNKYQSADGIIRQTLRICPDMGLMRGRGDNTVKKKVIGIYSPIGRCGKTSLAFAIVRTLSRSSKTLYLNFEEFSGIERFLGADYQETLSDAVYHLQQGKLDAQKLAALICRGSGIDFIPPFKYVDDMYSAGGEMFEELIRKILEESDYEAVVIDMDSFSNVASELMDMCDCVYMPVVQDMISAGKVRCFEDYLELSGRKILASKIIRIEMPSQPEIRSSPDTYIESVLYGPVGDIARRLCQGGNA